MTDDGAVPRRVAPRPERAALAACVTLGLVAACGTGQGADPTPAAEARPPLSGQFTPRRLPRPVPTAAEPAASPVTTTTPAGRTIEIGNAPEGIVADATTRRVVVAVRGPDELVLLDPTTLAVRGRTPLPGSLRHLQLAAAGGPVLVPDESSTSLLRVALPSGRVLSRTPTGAMPHDANQAPNGTVLVADEAGATLTAIRDDRVVATFTDVTQPGGIAHVGDVFGVVDVGENTITFDDAATLQPLTELSAGDGPTHVVADKHGRLVVVDTRGGALLLYSAPPQAAQVARVALPGQPYGVAYDARRDELWVTVTASNELVRLDLSGDQPRETARYPTVQQPNTVAVDETTGRVFVTGTTPGLLQVVDP
ncbi:DNA-binding beta-propeller fold protein YncE [Microlunatus sagamiharensis]|uniref:DNA-binding beta-propeller fold protein YncE n=1 Tax=Microlunatus sagamiharensis TaxID=546874 RepID=A0A1H2LQT7_9ACTN|nr:DNA-binding beta-propeller fold protein YncE [Microlunatus sagamiharensis]